jgi:acetyltransferase
MSLYRLDTLFAPRSVAVVGASSRPGSMGAALLANLRRTGFAGALWPINPRYESIDGLACAPSLAALPERPDLAVIATPAAAVLDIVSEAARQGVPAAIVITALPPEAGHAQRTQIGTIARSAGLRLVGPNCFGVLSPHAKLDASFASRPAKPGSLAFVSQSGAIAAALLEWADPRGVGFSGIVSLGDQIDVDVGDCLDYFAADVHTRAILLYVEAIRDVRKFMSASRAAARIKPVIVLKSGRHQAGAAAAHSHTGALAGSDEVYAAAFRRAGLVRVLDLDELIAAAETLSRFTAFDGERIGVLTNGGGLGVLAVDRLADLGGTLAPLTPATRNALNAVLPPTWSRGNPVDIIGDADAARYEAATRILLDDPSVDALLAMNCPTALLPSAAAATAVAGVVRDRVSRRLPRKPVFAVWLGDRDAADVTFDAAGVPNFPTEVEAVRGIMHLIDYRRGQAALMQTPENVDLETPPAVATFASEIDQAIVADRKWLDPLLVDRLLAAYGIPTVPLAAARTAEEAAVHATPILATGAACALKIHSRDIVHKSDIGGVALGLTSVAAVRAETDAMLARVATAAPQARIDGVLVQAMVHRPGALELIAGIADDPTFGTVMLFGRGGKAVEVVRDRALALPPLDMALARDMIARTRISRLMAGYRDVPPVDIGAVAQVLVRLSRLAADLPGITEVDLNPILVDAKGLVVVDARVAVGRPPSVTLARGGHPRFAIRPYPAEWERKITTSRGTELVVRPVRPEDEPLYHPFFAKIDPSHMRQRFFAPIRTINHAFIARLTHMDYARAMAFLALDPTSGELLGVVRLHADPDNVEAEFAILVRSDRQGLGLGAALMKLIVEYGRAQGTRRIIGQVFRENTRMLALCAEIGFRITPDADDSSLQTVTLDL